MKNNRIHCTAVLTLTALLTLCTGCGDSKPSTGTPSADIPVFTLETTSVPQTTTAAEETTSSETTAVTTTITESTTSTTEMTTTEAPEPFVPSDGSALITPQTDGSLLVSFHDGACTMTFPASWTDRFYIKENTVYNRMYWENEEGCGALFSIIAEENTHLPSLSGTPCYLMGSSLASGALITWYTPQDTVYDLADPTMVDDYTSMAVDLEAIRNSTVCDGTAGQFTPVDMMNYAVSGGEALSWTGTWMITGSNWAQWSPQLTLCSDGTFVYNYGMELHVGSYLLNTVNPISNMHPEGGSTGIAYFDGKLREFNIYHSAPVTFCLSNMLGYQDDPNFDYYNESIWTFTYWNSSESYGLDEWMQ